MKKDLYHRSFIIRVLTESLTLLLASFGEFVLSSEMIWLGETSETDVMSVSDVSVIDLFVGFRACMICSLFRGSDTFCTSQFKLRKLACWLK